MNIDQLSTQGRKELFGNLAARRYVSLQNMKNETLSDCFAIENDSHHRMKSVAKVQNIEFIDDAGATTPNATWYALESMTRPVVWIAEAAVETTDYIDLIPMVFGKVKAIVCIGNPSNSIVKTFAGLVEQIVWAENIEDATLKAYSIADSEEIVLFSPSSKDGNKSAEKGRAFCQTVNEL